MSEKFDFLYQIFVFVMLLNLTMRVNNCERSRKEERVPIAPNFLLSLLILGTIALGLYGGYELNELSKKIHIEWKAE